MSWSIEEHIGEGRPWPAQVVVYRGETDECLAYVSGEVADRLQAENAKLRERIHDLEMEGSDHFYRTAYAEDENRTLEAENANLCQQLADVTESNANLCQQLADVTESIGRVEERCAKLREYVAELEELLPENGRWYRAETVEAYVAEIAKLRELVRRYVEYTSQDRCEGCVCKSRCNEGDVEECWQLTEIRGLARELVIEV